MDSQLVPFNSPKSNHLTSLLHSTIPNPHHLILVLEAHSWSGTQDARLAKVRSFNPFNGKIYIDRFQPSLLDSLYL